MYSIVKPAYPQRPWSGSRTGLVDGSAARPDFTPAVAQTRALQGCDSRREPEALAAMFSPVPGLPTYVQGVADRLRPRQVRWRASTRSANQAVVSLRWILGLFRSIRGIVSRGRRVPVRLSARAKTLL